MNRPRDFLTKAPTQPVFTMGFVATFKLNMRKLPDTTTIDALCMSIQSISHSSSGRSFDLNIQYPKWYAFIGNLDRAQCGALTRIFKNLIKNWAVIWNNQRELKIRDLPYYEWEDILEGRELYNHIGDRGKAFIFVAFQKN